MPLPCLRLRGDYLAIVTLGFNEIVGVIIRAQGPVGRINLGGPRGFNEIPGGLAGGFVDIYIDALDRPDRRWEGSSEAVAVVPLKPCGKTKSPPRPSVVNTTRTKVQAFVLSSFFRGDCGRSLCLQERLDQRPCLRHGPLDRLRRHGDSRRQRQPLGSGDRRDGVDGHQRAAPRVRTVADGGV